MKIVLVSYFAFPSTSVGAIRPEYLGQFLAENGHQILLVTAFGQDSRKVSVDNIRRLVVVEPSVVNWKNKFGLFLKRQPFLSVIRLLQSIFFWIDEYNSWSKHVEVELEKYLAVNNYDLLYVSGPPFSQFRTAQNLNKKIGIPWVAEYRDLWADNHLVCRNHFIRFFARRYERRMLGSSTFSVTVSSPLAERLKLVSSKVFVIKNGFNTSLPVDRALEQTNHKTIRLVYTGSIYYNVYDWENVLETLLILKRRDVDVKLILAGPSLERFVSTAKRLKVDNYIEYKGTISHQAVQSLQSSADILLFFPWKNSEGILTSKLSEYFFANKFIASVGCDTDVVRLIHTLGRGALFESAKALADWITDLSQQRDLGGASRIHLPEDVDVTQFSAQYQFQLLYDLLQNHFSNG